MHQRILLALNESHESRIKISADSIGTLDNTLWIAYSSVRMFKKSIAIKYICIVISVEGMR